MVDTQDTGSLIYVHTRARVWIDMCLSVYGVYFLPILLKSFNKTARHFPRHG